MPSPRKNPESLIIRLKTNVVRINASVASIENFKLVTGEGLRELFVERSEEIAAIQYCLLTRTHLMLEGLHGIAKSMLAEQTFKRILGAKIFHKMMMKTTSPDELFGPMNSNLYREKAIWRHNTTDMLPEAHFLFLDEVYRASDHALPALLNILNERTFVNGTELVRCPLLTAIGTTNFTTDTDELKAFHDRWHVRIQVQPLASVTTLTKLFDRYLRRENSAKVETLSLDELIGLQEAVLEVKIPSDLLQPYADLTLQLARSLDTFISDRRKCLGLRFVQASAVLAGRKVATSDDLAAARFALITVREPKQENEWGAVYAKCVGQWERDRAEIRDLLILEKWAKAREAELDTKMSKHDLKSSWEQVLKARAALRNQPASKEPTTAQGLQKKSQVLAQLDGLLANLSDLSPTPLMVPKALSAAEDDNGGIFDDGVDPDTTPQG